MGRAGSVGPPGLLTPSVPCALVSTPPPRSGGSAVLVPSPGGMATFSGIPSCSRFARTSSAGSARGRAICGSPTTSTPTSRRSDRTGRSRTSARLPVAARHHPHCGRARATLARAPAAGGGAEAVWLPEEPTPHRQTYPTSPHRSGGWVPGAPGLGAAPEAPAPGPDGAAPAPAAAPAAVPGDRAPASLLPACCCVLGARAASRTAASSRAACAEIARSTLSTACATLSVGSGFDTEKSTMKGVKSRASVKYRPAARYRSTRNA